MRGLTLGEPPAVARRDGKVVASIALDGKETGFDLQPIEPGRFVLTSESGLSLRVGATGAEVTVSVSGGTQMEMHPDRLVVKKGLLRLDGAQASAPLEIGAGNALVRRREPRPGERHPLLRSYESTPNP